MSKLQAERKEITEKYSFTEAKKMLPGMIKIELYQDASLL